MDIKEQKQTDKNNNGLKTGYVYSIRSHNTDKIYIGSTFQRLSKRLYGHKSQYKCYLKNNTKNCSNSKEILKHGGAYIELIKEVQVKNRLELNKYEGEEQRKNKDIIVNIRMECQTPEEKKQYFEEYRDLHKEELKKYLQEYYKDNKDKYKEKCKEYYNTHKEKLKEKHKEYRDLHKEKAKKYRETHKEKIRKQQNEKINCLECGTFISRGNISTHRKTKKHIKNSKSDI